MPFTLSHAAAVLPAIRRTGRARGPLVASALVVGSFAPDTFYFADAVVQGLFGYGDFAHSAAGVLTVDAALSAALCAYWLLLREPLLALLPRARRGRAYAFVRGEDWRERRPAPLALWFYLSAVAGSATHVGWDGFTHPHRWGTEALPRLGEPFAFGLPLYSFVQYGTSALAACALLWFVVSALRRTPAPPAAPAAVPELGRGTLWAAAALVTGCVAAGITLRVIRYFTFFDRIRTPLDIIPTVCFGAGGGLAVGLLLYGALVRLRHRPGPAGPTGPAGPAGQSGRDARTPVPTA
ncbi:DUF4184 family protein [Streptomyces sp. NPDC059982]|uniref:DUF4184 family protein n=1 Tax=unclassified Streptomyces TaxID=2593676 RepID=UPI003688C18E